MTMPAQPLAGRGIVITRPDAQAGPLAGELTRRGHPVSAPTAGRLLRGNGFSLQGNAKVLEGEQHPDRDAQFQHINATVKAAIAAGEPAISVDTKKKGVLQRHGRSST